MEGKLLLGSGETEGSHLAPQGGPDPSSICTHPFSFAVLSNLGQEEEDEVDKKRESRAKIAEPHGGALNWDDTCSDDSDDSYVGDDDDDDDDEDVRNIPKNKAKQLSKAWVRTVIQRIKQHDEACHEVLRRDGEGAIFPPFPLDVLPEATSLCALRGDCYHRRYRTHDTSTTDSTLGYGRPEEMLQVFSLRLSTFAESYPVTVYGIFAVRDELEPLRNYVFNRSRDDAVMVDKDPFTLHLCSPCRGMYLLDSVLFEVDLWIKKEGDGSADKPLLAEYAELEMRSEFNETLRGCIPSDSCSLDIDYNVLTEAVEAVIEVSADIDQLHHVRITAFSSCLDHEFVLFDDEFSGKKLFKHVLAVKANEKLDVRLELEESLFQWTFQDADVGAVCCADESISKYGQFDVTVAYANDHPALMAMGDSYPGELKRNNICRSEEESDDNLDYDDNDGVVTDEETNYPDLSTFGHHKPNQMLQIFSACLSSSAESYPISVYGIVAIWDYLEPLHNHVFNQARDDAAMIEQDSLTLPLCSPCRGMYVQDRALLEVDLWVKKEGDGSADKQLLSAYVELDVGSDFNEMLNGRIPRDCCSMDIDYMILTEGIEAVIEVSAEVDCPRHVRFAALSSPFDREIVLFDEKNCGMKLFKHVIAVKAKEELDICLELERSLFQWTFQDGNVGAVSFPDDSILKYGQFHVSVLFVPNNRQTKSKITVIA